MQRKVKKGCGRVRYMPVKDLTQVFTQYKGLWTITPGKLYRAQVCVGHPTCRDIMHDHGRTITIKIVGTCAHLDGIGRWEHPFK